MSDLPFLSVVVPVHNGERTLRETLEVLCNQDYEKERMEIIVVDDFSTDASAVIARDFPVLMVRNAANLGLSASLNEGIRRSRGRVIITLHQDCIPLSKDWARCIASHFVAISERAAISSFLVLEDNLSFLDTIFAHIYIQGWKKDFDRTKLLSHDGLVEVNFVGDKCDAFDRDALEKVGYFDEDFFSSNEDLVLSHRLRERGFRLFLDKDLTVQHELGSASLRSHLGQALRRARSQAVVLSKLGYFAGTESIIPFASLLPSLILLTLKTALDRGVVTNLFLGVSAAILSVISIVWLSSKGMPPFYRTPPPGRSRFLARNFAVLSLSVACLLVLGRLGLLAASDLLLATPAAVGISLVALRAALRGFRSARYRYRRIGAPHAVLTAIAAFFISLLFDFLYAVGVLQGAFLFRVLRRRRL